jgi:malate synthase
MAWDHDFVNPNIDAITVTYGYMREYEDRVRRAVSTRDAQGRFALWQGGMEANIPIAKLADERDEADDRRGRTGTARRGERQMGFALEDGSHRPPSVGKMAK